MGSGTRACDHAHHAWYAARRTCCSNGALVGGMFSIVREHCANNSFLVLFTPLAEHILLFFTIMDLSIFFNVSELMSTGWRDRSRKASVTDGQELHVNRADFYPRPRTLDTVLHPLTAWKSINAVSLIVLSISWIEICRK